MLEKNYKLAEMIFLEQVMGAEELDGRGDRGGGERLTLRGGGVSPGIWASSGLGRTLRKVDFTPP